MVWNRDLWLELIQNDEKVAFLIPLWKLYIEKIVKRDLTWEYFIRKEIKRDLTIADHLYFFQPDLKYNKDEVIYTSDNLSLKQIIEFLPATNIILLLGDQEIYDLLIETIGFNQKGFIRCVMGDQIRVWNDPRNKQKKPYSIRKYWYRLFKPKLQRIYQIAHEMGEYQYDVLIDPNFYENLPRLISTMVQYWATNQIKKETKKSKMFELAQIERNVVAEYSDMGIRDKSRKRDWINRKISLKYILEYFKQFKDKDEFKEVIENQFDVMATIYCPLDEIIDIIEKEIEIEENDEDHEFYILCLVEKDADYDEILSIANLMGISVLSAHGQNALASLEEFIVNYMKKDSKVIFLSITDCDPSGFSIAKAFAQLQPIKLGINPLMWIHSIFWNKLTLDERKYQSYIPKQVSKKKRTKLVDWWIKNIAYDIEKDVFGGGRFGFEIEAVPDKVFRLSVKDLFYCIGINALAMLETLKDENREDIDECSRCIAEEWFEDQESELKEQLKRLQSFEKKLTIPITNILYDFFRLKDNILDEITNQVLPVSSDIVSEDDFDERDAKQYIESFEKDLLKGKDYWLGKYSADVCNGDVLDKKLKKELGNIRDKIIDIELENYEIPNINKDELIKETITIIQDFDFGDGENKLSHNETFNEDELEKTYWKIREKIGWFADKRYVRYFNNTEKESILELIKKENMDIDEIIENIKEEFEKAGW